MQSKEILQQALKQYDGSFIIVSHDVDFLDPIVNKVLEVRPDETATYLGNVSYYLDKKKGEDSETPENQTSNQANTQDTRSRKEERKIKARKRRKKSKKMKPFKKEFEQKESSIEKLEVRKQDIETTMAEPDFYDDKEKVKEISLEYDKLKAELVEAYARWEELAEKISAIEEEFSSEL
jgi:ATP-binding cassette subfamily F protein 3